MLLVGMLTPLSIIHQCSSIELDLMYTVGDSPHVARLPEAGAWSWAGNRWGIV